MNKEQEYQNNEFESNTLATHHQVLDKCIS